MSYKTVAAENAPDLMPGIDVPDYVANLVNTGLLRTPYTRPKE